MELHNNLQWDSFADGWPNIFIENVKEIAGRDGKGRERKGMWNEMWR